MRPRIYAGKDIDLEAELARAREASMRPRIYAGKDASELMYMVTDGTKASMRPRIYAGKDDREVRR